MSPEKEWVSEERGRARTAWCLGSHFHTSVPAYCNFLVRL
jgi:hypothetical protein